MGSMNAHEGYMAQIPNARESAHDREVQKENMLQLGWFEHRCQNMLDGEHLDARLAELAVNDSELQAQIARSTTEEKRTIILHDMILSPHGSAEAAWFRVHFPSDKNVPLAPEYRMILENYSEHPEEAYAELDRLFVESVTKH